jgi:23S rRNA (guanosine2251-2'-O)-methyltransferase
MQLIKGKHAVLEALQSSVKIDRIVIPYGSEKKADIQAILRTAAHKRISVQVVSHANFQKAAQEAQNQGIIAYIIEKPLQTLEHLIDNIDHYPIIMILDHLEDPFNFGAILRTCDAFGVKAVIYPKDRNSQISPGVIKASSGAIYHLDLIKVVNIGQAIQKLKAAGYWMYGSDVNNGVKLQDLKPAFPAGIIVGNEANGQSRLVSKLMDSNVHIPMSGKMSSLNVSVAAGIMLYTVSQAYANQL